MDWNTIVLAALTGFATLAGAWLNQRGQRRADRERHVREDRRRAWEAKRDAYIELVQAYDRVESATGGVVTLGHGSVPGDVQRRFVEAVSVAEFYAPPDVWERASPALEAAAAKANYVAAGEQDALDLVEELGAKTADGALALRSEMLAALRRDLDG